MINILHIIPLNKQALLQKAELIWLFRIAYFARATPFNYTFPSGTGQNGTIQITKTAKNGSNGTDTIGFTLK